MNQTIKNIEKKHNTKHGRLAFGVGEILIAFIFGSLAVDSGAIWQYLIAFVLFIGGVHNLISAEHLARNHAKKAKS